MIFTDIPAGADVFLDANTFIYYFTADPGFGPACAGLLTRIKGGDIVGWTSTHVLGEVSHRLMTIEAVKKYGWAYAGIAAKLGRHPVQVQQRSEFRQAIQEIPKFGVHILTVLSDFIDKAAAVSQQTGLLSNDALTVTIMQHHGISNVASHDSDFDRVAGLTRYAPV